mmetsp:Transcript_3229/g.7327  ORF Transcript_3229/g.7327 Transcript_3229/m.7327 type:complete len:228 (-) Transcript_3229:124-807(-)
MDVSVCTELSSRGKHSTEKRSIQKVLPCQPPQALNAPTCQLAVTSSQWPCASQWSATKLLRDASTAPTSSYVVLATLLPSSGLQIWKVGRALAAASSAKSAISSTSTDTNRPLCCCARLLNTGAMCLHGLHHDAPTASTIGSPPSEALLHTFCHSSGVCTSTQPPLPSLSATLLTGLRRRVAPAASFVVSSVCSAGASGGGLPDIFCFVMAEVSSASSYPHFRLAHR